MLSQIDERKPMLIPQTFKDFLFAEGRPVRDPKAGGSEIALPLRRASSAIDLLLGSRIAVLGGDFVEPQGAQFKYEYVNWACNKGKGEHPIEFTRRSHQVAHETIAKYGKEYPHWWVVLVCSELGLT